MSDAVRTFHHDADAHGQGTGEPPPLPLGYRRLAAAIVLQAVKDLRRGGDAARSARPFLLVELWRPGNPWGAAIGHAIPRQRFLAALTEGTGGGRHPRVK